MGCSVGQRSVSDSVELGSFGQKSCSRKRRELRLHLIHNYTIKNCKKQVETLAPVSSFQHGWIGVRFFDGNN
jgi:hypothetical protein